MADNIQILISSLIDPTSIAKMRQQLADVGKNISMNPTTRISAQLFKGSEKDIELFKRNMENSIKSLQIGKSAIFSRPEITEGLKKLQSSVSSFGTNGGKSIKEIRTQFSEFSTTVKEAAVNMHSVQKEGYGAGEMLAVAAKKMLAWKVIGDAIFGTLNLIKQGVSYVMDLDNALNDVRIVTGYTQEQVEGLADSYGKLAKEMSVTTLEIAKQSAELYRQGLADKEVEERMKGIITYAKISGLSIDESGKIITATMNATGRSIDDVINIFAYLGDMTAAG